MFLNCVAKCYRLQNLRCAPTVGMQNLLCGMPKHNLEHATSKVLGSCITTQSKLQTWFPNRNFSTSSKPAKPVSTLKLVTIAVAVSVSLSSGYTYWKIKKEEAKVERFLKSQPKNVFSSEDHMLASPPPAFKPSRQVVNTSKDIGFKLTLFQFQTCPFCCKARVLLDYFGFNYDIVEVNSVMRQQIKWSTYRKVPILIAEANDGSVFQLNDSSLIVSALKSFLQNEGATLENVLSCYPKIKSIDETSGKEVSEISNKYFVMFEDQKLAEDDKKQIANERKWRRWVDDSLVHTLSPNVYRTPSEALQAFQWFDKTGNWENFFSTWERTFIIYVGAAAMYLIGKKLKKKHQLKPDVRESLYDEINRWMKTIRAKKTTFMGGDQPDLSDLAVFGVLSAIEGCEAFEDLKKNTKISIWYEAMKTVCLDHSGSKLLENKVIEFVEK